MVAVEPEHQIAGQRAPPGLVRSAEPFARFAMEIFVEQETIAELGIVLEEIGANLTPSPFLISAVAFVEALKGTKHGERWYPGIIAGESLMGVAIAILGALHVLR